MFVNLHDRTKERKKNLLNSKATFYIKTFRKICRSTPLTLMRIFVEFPSFSVTFGESLFYRSSRPEVFLRKGVLKICIKFTGEYPCRSLISIKLLCNFIETTLRCGCSPVNLLHIFRIAFPKNTYGWLLLFLAHFPPAPELSVNSMQVTPFYFQLKFLAEKLMELR